MSFINYNFFPILFFLGWNILTTKQFSSTISNTSNSKILPSLSVFSLTNLTNQKTVQKDLKPCGNDPYLFPGVAPQDSKSFNSCETMGQNLNKTNIFYSDESGQRIRILGNKTRRPEKKMDIVEFVSKFQCLSEKQKLILKKNNIKPITKPIQWVNLALMNKTRGGSAGKYYYTNYNLPAKRPFNNYWKINFQSNFFDFSGINTKKFNNINFRQKRRLNIKSLLQRLTQGSLRGAPNVSYLAKRWGKTQKIYSLNKFQIALCFSKILKPSIFINDNYGSSLTPKISRGATLNPIFHDNQPSVIWQKPNHERVSVFPNRENSKASSDVLNFVKQCDGTQNRLEPQTIVSKISFLDNNVFIEPNQKTYGATVYFDHYNPPPSRSAGKKNWYMKTQFFQHIAWNMKHKISSSVSDAEYLLHTNSLPIKNNDNSARVYLPFYSKQSQGVEPKPSEIASYQKKQHFSTTNSHESIKIEKKDLNTIPFANKSNHDNVLKNDKNMKPPGATPYKFSQNSNLIIYGGSWYYENLTFSYNIFNVLPLTSIAPLSAKLNNTFKSDIGIYSLAHKLSSVGFHNGNSEIDIYPFKYNDSYRYNFQNMNLSNQRLQSFLTEQDFMSPSGIKNKTRAESVWAQNERENTEASKKTNFSNFRKFLNFQNPTFSKIYAPLFQPQGLNLLSFI